MRKVYGQPLWIILFLLLSWPLYLNDLWLQTLIEWSLAAVWIADLICYTFVPVVTAILFFKVNWLSFEDLSLGSKFKPTHFIAGIALCPVYVYLFQGLLAAHLSPFIWGAIHSGHDFPSQEPLHTLTILYASLSAGLIEEVLFRGFLTRKLAERLNSQFAVVAISSTLFGLIHWGSGVGMTVYTVLWAIPVTVWFFWKRDIWTLIAFHALYDFIAFKDWI